MRKKNYFPIPPKNAFCRKVNKLYPNVFTQNLLNHRMYVIDYLLKGLLSSRDYSFEFHFTSLLEELSKR